MKIKPPYNVNVAAQVAVLASLADMEYLQKTIEAIIEERGRLFAKLEESEFIQPLPSKANFILCYIRNNEASWIHQELQRKSIFTRYFDTPLLKNYLRISVGKPEHTDALIEALGQIC
jgi:histidinol-phosphate aminotransferase